MVLVVSHWRDKGVIERLGWRQSGLAITRIERICLVGKMSMLGGKEDNDDG